MEKILPFLWLGLYVLGVFLSQSLLSLGGALGLIFTYPVFKSPPLNRANPLFWALAWILLAAFNLYRFSAEVIWSDYKTLPLLLLPLVGLAWPLPSLKDAKVKKALSIIILLVCVLSAAALCRSLFQALIQKRPATGLMRNQIYFAYSILPFFLFFAELSLLQRISEKLRLTAAGLTGIFGLMLLLSHTRMTWIVMLSWGAVRGLPYLWRRPKKKAFMITIAAAALSAGFLFLYQPDFQNKIGRIFDSNDPSRVSRSVIWSYNWDLFLERPLFGSGVERNGTIIADNSTRELFLKAGLNPDYKIYAHNTFLQTLVDNGLVGFFFWLGFWLYLARDNRKTALYLAFMALAGLTENIFNNSRAFHPFYLGCILFLFLDRALKEEVSSGERIQST